MKQGDLEDYKRLFGIENSDHFSELVQKEFLIRFMQTCLRIKNSTNESEVQKIFAILTKEIIPKLQSEKDKFYYYKSLFLGIQLKYVSFYDKAKILSQII